MGGAGWQSDPDTAARGKWKINVGPLPVVVRHQADHDEEWAWRVSNLEHITVVIVRIPRDIFDTHDRSEFVDDVIASKGFSAVKSVMHWERPPREIRFPDPFGEPTYWAGAEEAE